MESGRAVDVGAVRFGRLSAAALRGRRQYDVYLEPGVLAPAVRDLTSVFGDDTVRLNGREVYRREQAAAAVPYPAGAAATPAYVPAELVGKSNRQLWDEYHLAVGGAVAPATAEDFGRPRTNGLVGAGAAHLPALALASKKYVSRLPGYSLVYTPAGGQPVRDPLPADLHEGWNLVTRAVGGVRRTFLVYGDTTAPVLLPQRSPLVVNPLALSRGFTVEATVADDSIGPVVITRTFTGLPERPVQRRADGSRFIALDFPTSDLAGNGARTVLELNLDDAAPL
jgi:hypothetical protein